MQKTNSETEIRAIMAGTGANSTAEAIELSHYAREVGADCTLSVVPYYNQPSQAGIYRRFKAIAEAVGDSPSHRPTTSPSTVPMKKASTVS